MMETFSVPGASDNVLLSTLVIAPESPKAVLQLVHGMAEHKERYIPFMNYLAEMGYACVICDLRGHGASVTDKEDLGWMGKGGMTALVDDVLRITDWAKTKYPGLPFFLMGHSMGSMIVRSYIKRFDKELDGLIVCGSPSKNPAAGLGNFLVLLLQQVVILRILLTLTIETVEEPQQENHQQNGNDNGEQHPVELAGLMVENACTGFEFTILACLLLQVYIDVTIKVTLGLVVDG